MRPERALVDSFAVHVTPRAADEVSELAAVRLEAARLHNQLERERAKHAGFRASVERLAQHLAGAAQASGDDARASLGSTRAGFIAGERFAAEELRRVLDQEPLA